MARKMRWLGKNRQRMADHRFLDTLEHGDVVDEPVATLNFRGGRRGMTAPWRPEGEAIGAPNVDTDRTVSELHNGPLQRLRHAGLAQRAGMDHDRRAQCVPE